jgi:protein tyrosine phosphatase (PTP) superfamily phosphohydrolase (DUF442 family)
MQQIRDFVRLAESIATAGQPTAAQFRLVAEAGFDFVVNLAMPDDGEALADEGAIVARLGMGYVHLPVPWTAPTMRHVRTFCRIMGALDDGRVFVHCAANRRVSAFCYHYLTKVVGLSHEQARSPIFDVWKPEGVWADVMSWTDADIGA